MAPPKTSNLARLAGWSHDRRRVVALAWVLILVGVGFASSKLAGDYSMSFSTPGSESDEARAILGERFPERAGDTVEVVFGVDAGAFDTQGVREIVDNTLSAMTRVENVTAAESPYNPGQQQSRVAQSGRVFYATLLLDVPADQFERESARRLIAIAEENERPSVRIELSGYAIQNAEEIEPGSEGIGLLVAAFILLLSFGSALAMGLPILVAVCGLGIASGLIALLANLVETPEWAPQVAAMIGIGVGIDYVLFIVTRYRSFLAAGREPRDSVLMAIDTSGRAVMFAGCVVIIALMGLFVMNLAFLRGVALAAVSAVLVVMLASITLLPALLGFVGRTIDRFHVPFVGKKLAGDKTSLSYRWSRVVQRYPWPAALLASGLLIALTLPLFGLRFGFPDAGNDPKEFTTRQAYDLMTDGFGSGINGPLVLVAEAANPSALEANLTAAWEDARNVPGVAFSPPPTPNPAGDAATILVFPATSPQSEETEDLVQTMRRSLPDGDEFRVLVGGATAASIDATRYVADRLALFIGVVVVLSFLLLLVVFRSLLVSLKAALLNVLSISAAYGAVAIAVQGGWFGSIFGINEPVPVPSFIPMMMFAILFGLSMDYEVFLLSRIREEYGRTGDNAVAVADGLAATARVITAAAAIMISVFLAFVLGDIVFLKIIGVGLATAIFLDATIVRMILVPATMELLGNANWWLPKWLARILPEVHIEGHVDDAAPVPAGR
jgi:putative drug exporter of the RND superfamily